MSKMPLSVFQYEPPYHFREVIGKVDPFGHTFGGDLLEFDIRVASDNPLQLLYRLNQADPAVAVGIPGVNWLPLCHSFSFAGEYGTLIYRVVNDAVIELITPLNAAFDPYFSLRKVPRVLPKRDVAFEKQRYDPTVAEDALKLAAVFGIDRLAESEMKRAIALAEQTSGTISSWTLPDWAPEDVLRCSHRQPFIQGAPVKMCDNPNCTAEIVGRTEELTVAIDDEDFQQLTGLPSLAVEACDIRRDSMRVFAIYETGEGDDCLWPGMQWIFECCDACGCIRVTNQCD